MGLAELMADYPNWDYDGWSNLAKVVYKRTYSREQEDGMLENWPDSAHRTIRGNLRLVDEAFIEENEEKELFDFFMERKATTAGRGLWVSGTELIDKIGGASLNNCWYFSGDKWENFILAQDLLMLGGGVGMSVEHRFVCKLPAIVDANIEITHQKTNDADFIIPDSREGWNELTRKVLEAFFVTGKGFTYSTICVRGAREKIKGFGGVSSGPLPLIEMVDNLVKILSARKGRHLRPIDAADVLCSIGSMVVSGNVRRSALMILGDPWDKEFLTVKRWDLHEIPNIRYMANFSVVAETYDDLHPLFWDSYFEGEPIGIFNRKNAQKYARMGVLKKDKCQGVNPCVTGDTEIMTESGFQRIDYLLESPVKIWNGFEWSEVQPKITGENQEILKIKFSDGRELKCTHYHKFHLVHGYKGNFVIKEARELSIGDKLIKHSFPVLREGKEGNQTDLYTQGFYSADGTKNSDIINLYEPKYSLLEHLNVRKIGNESANNFGTKRQVCKVNFKTKPKDWIPSEYDLKSKLAWLGGLIDGDGCEIKEGGCQLSSTDVKFLKNVQSFLATLGVNSKVCKGREAGFRDLPDQRGGTKKFLCQEVNRISIGSTEMQELKDLGLHCKRLKFDKSPQRSATRFTQVVSVESLGVEEFVYCFNEPKRHLGIFNGVITGQCAEATLESGEPCNLWEIFLSNFTDKEELLRACRLATRGAIRTTCADYHIPEVAAKIKENRRIGIGLTGILNAKFFTEKDLDDAYAMVEKTAEEYCAQLGIPNCIRLTVIKPSGTLGKMGDVLEGCHAAYSRFMIQRIRFASNDLLIPELKAAGHPVEFERKQDGTINQQTSVVEFYLDNGPDVPCADDGFDTWKQLDTVLMLQKHWADQSVSVTVYYEKEKLEDLKAWLKENLENIKSISFLLHQGHGFIQAPKEAITKEVYEEMSKKIRPLDISTIGKGLDIISSDCESGACPVR